MVVMVETQELTLARVAVMVPTQVPRLRVRVATVVTVRLVL
jgi:hypothetical protein